jgi:hypothetical protein
MSGFAGLQPSISFFLAGRLGFAFGGFFAP